MSIYEKNKGGGRGELRGGDVPSTRVSPGTLLSYKGGYHSRWPQGRRAYFTRSWPPHLEPSGVFILVPPLILFSPSHHSLLAVFFIWMLHGSTKVVVRAVALLSAKTKVKVAMSLSKLKYFLESNNCDNSVLTKKTNLIAVSQRVQGSNGVACSSDS